MPAGTKLARGRAGECRSADPQVHPERRGPIFRTDRHIVALALDKNLYRNADPDQLQQVFINLINNSLDAMPGGGTLTISSETVTLGSDFVQIYGYGSPGRYALLTVSDTGPGISDEDLPHIFDRYYRSEKTSGIKGTGLGLAVVKSFVEAHKGSVAVDSRPGVGSTFTVKIPVKA